MASQPMNPFTKLLVKKPAATPIAAKPATTVTPPAPVSETVPANPMLSLLASPGPTEQPVTNVSGSAVDSVHELAHMDTESMEPTTERPKNSVLVKTAQRTQQVKLTSGEEVRTLCDRVDVLIESQEFLAGPSLIELRGYVQTLMVTLKERPEFEGIVLDKDIRNIMRFIRAVREEALSLRAIKTEKKATRASKKESNIKINQSMQAAFNAIVLGGKFKL